MTTSDYGRRTDSPDADADADARGVPRSGAPGRFVTTAEAPRGAGHTRPATGGAPRTAPDDGASRPVVAVGPGPAAPTRPAPAAAAAPAGPVTGERTGPGAADPAKAEAHDRAQPDMRPDAGRAGTADGAGAHALLPSDLTQQLTHRLDHAVGTFVDDPRQAVQEADEALDETVRRLTDGLRERRTALHDAWHADTAGEHRGAADGASRTEDLRLLLREYRDLVQHLLAV
ncbi:hypothetical protein ACGFX4_36270 [Kitasatospora sp. NPDC048365]|uniref:hypothetical protein n=1 Tax=Kitasatospora sp. NPDC048365 TaxID=3364050 RepID=UPI003716D7BF